MAAPVSALRDSDISQAKPGDLAALKAGTGPIPAAEQEHHLPGNGSESGSGARDTFSNHRLSAASAPGEHSDEDNGHQPHGEPDGASSEHSNGGGGSVEPEPGRAAAASLGLLTSGDQRFDHSSNNGGGSGPMANANPAPSPGPAAVPAAGYGYNHYRGPFHQHGGQQSPGMGAALHPGGLDSFQPNSHEAFGHYNNYTAAYPARSGYTNQGYGLNSPRAGAAGPKASASNIAPSFQRFGGQHQQSAPVPGLQQQSQTASSTPTLNQLLTSPSGARAFTNYNQAHQDYNSSQELAKGGELGAQYASAGWAAAQQRIHHPPISPGNSGQPLLRTQVKITSS